MVSDSGRIIVVYKTSRECMEKAKKIVSLMRSRGYDVLAYTVDDLVRENVEKPDIVISIGGDGTLLKISRTYQQYTPLVLPIPCGRRTAFYEEIGEEMYEEIIEKLEKKLYTLEVLRRIRVFVEDREYLALNEALIISRDRGRVTGFTVSIKSLSLNSTLSFDGDGVIIGAAPGSAAYNLSVKGPLIDYLSDNIFITPLNPMELNISPIIVPLFSKIRVKSRGYTELYVDGEKVYDVKPHTELYFEPTNRNFRVIRFYTSDYVKRVYSRRKIVFE